MGGLPDGSKSRRNSSNGPLWKRWRLIEEMAPIVNQPVPASIQPVEPGTAWLGTPNFEPALMTAPLRWF
jgi:hypothetical protein